MYAQSKFMTAHQSGTRCESHVQPYLNFFYAELNVYTSLRYLILIYILQLLTKHLT